MIHEVLPVFSILMVFIVNVKLCPKEAPSGVDKVSFPRGISHNAPLGVKSPLKWASSSEV